MDKFKKKIKDFFKKRLKKEYLPFLALILVGFHALTKMSYAFRTDYHTGFERLIYAFTSIDKIYQPPIITTNVIDIAFASAVYFIAYLIVKDKATKNKIKTRQNEEYGSARWGKPEEIRDYMDKDPMQNLIFSKTEGKMLDIAPKNWKVGRNNNVVVVGGSGSGKTRYFVKPNIMQMHSSYVITDPKGTLLNEMGGMLMKGSPEVLKDKDGKQIRDKDGKLKYKIKKGKDGKLRYVLEPYKIKVLNLINFKKSMHYNPFAYIKSESDIMKLVNTIIINTKGEGDKAGEDFWVKAERLLYMAYIGLIFEEAPPEEQNFETLIMLINMSETREDDENYKNALDLKFEQLEKKNPDSFAVLQYKKYKLAAGKTAKSILISCGARLAPFDIKELRDLLAYDELELDTLGDRKTALFVIIPDTDSTFNFIVAMMYTQMFNLLCTKADDEYGGKLPVPVRCLLDEFANIGSIPQFEKLIATIRSRLISACIVLQTKSQLKAIYKDHADTIIGNCDTSIFLGGKEETTLKSLSQGLGKETIETNNRGETRGQSRSSSRNFQKVGRELMTQDELQTMDSSECIVEIRGLRPFKSEKYDITKHPNYKLTGDYDDRNNIDVLKDLLNPEVIFKGVKFKSEE